MKLLYTDSNLIGSKIIKWGLNEPVSHFAVSFDDSINGFGIVIHSHIQGVGITWFGDFIKKNRIKYCQYPKDQLSLEEEEHIYRALVTATFGKGYDKTAMAYFAYAALMHKAFGKPMPVKNLWADSGKFLCIEIYSVLHTARPDLFPAPAKDLAITSPFQVRSLVNTSKLIKELTWENR